MCQMMDFYGLTQILQFGLYVLMDGVSQEVATLWDIEAMLISKFAERYRFK